ncbi:hypothetical protein [Arthrobacter sp. A2-55]|uniref:hypothetical protein n=1 Tax=Arthrobacter sp. A2-55 TaxID=2897337 RepID=UPI0021CDA95F|nr:hypothetical protein [Arthrobacter sp. A2-55]MCU6479674.1 hypothetical protein [Arthrobacter sp. A2-55]
MNAAAGNPTYSINPLTPQPAGMLSQTAPLIVGINDPLQGSGTPARQQPKPESRQKLGPGPTAESKEGGAGQIHEKLAVDLNTHGKGGHGLCRAAPPAAV